jgi:hypothetical protein
MFCVCVCVCVYDGVRGDLVIENGRNMEEYYEGDWLIDWANPGKERGVNYVFLIYQRSGIVSDEKINSYTFTIFPVHRSYCCDTVHFIILHWLTYSRVGGGCSRRFSISA